MAPHHIFFFILHSLNSPPPSGLSSLPLTHLLPPSFPPFQRQMLPPPPPPQWRPLRRQVLLRLLLRFISVPHLHPILRAALYPALAHCLVIQADSAASPEAELCPEQLPSIDRHREQPKRRPPSECRSSSNSSSNRYNKIRPQVNIRVTRYLFDIV